MQFRSHDMLLKRIQLIQLGTLGFLLFHTCGRYNISDLNRVDCSRKVWDERRDVCIIHTSLHNAGDLKQRASLTHDSKSQNNIDEAVDQRRKQLIVYEKAKDISLNIC